MAWKKRLKKWSGLSFEWPSAFKIQDYEIRMRTFIAKQFVFFLFASVISFIWSKWSFTKQQKKAIFLLRFSRRASKCKGEWGKERLVPSNCFLRITLASCVRLALSSASLKKAAMTSTSSYVKGIHGYCSFSFAKARYPTNHAIEAFWKPSEAKVSQRTATSGASALWWMCSVEI